MNVPGAMPEEIPDSLSVDRAGSAAMEAISRCSAIVAMLERSTIDLLSTNVAPSGSNVSLKACSSGETVKVRKSAYRAVTRARVFGRELGAAGIAKFFNKKLIRTPA